MALSNLHITCLVGRTFLSLSNKVVFPRNCNPTKMDNRHVYFVASTQWFLYDFSCYLYLSVYSKVHVLISSCQAGIVCVNLDINVA